MTPALIKIAVTTRLVVGIAASVGWAAKPNNPSHMRCTSQPKVPE